MAYILEINDRIIDTKTNPKPTQNRSKTIRRMITKWVIRYVLANQNQNVAEV